MTQDKLQKMAELLAKPLSEAQQFWPLASDWLEEYEKRATAHIVKLRWQSRGNNAQGFATFFDPLTDVTFIHIPAGVFCLGEKSSGHKVYQDDFYLAETPVTCEQYEKFWDSTTGEQKRELFARVYDMLGGDAWLDKSKKLRWLGTKGWNFFYCLDVEKDFNTRDECIARLLQGPRWWKTANHAPAEWKTYNDKHPVIGVSWLESMAYCLWAGYTLPTEAQWGKAARGPLYLSDDKSKPNQRIYWGDEWQDGMVNCDGKIGMTTEVKDSRFAKALSPYGCRDMLGNVWEWYRDWYDEKFYDTIHDYTEQNPPAGSKNPAVLENPGQKYDFFGSRGGPWFFHRDGVRVSFRFWGPPALRDNSLGFRVCFAGVSPDSVL
jgi:formylglycine-generating enzyme required for sulfatase activity